MNSPEAASSGASDGCDSSREILSKEIFENADVHSIVFPKKKIIKNLTLLCVAFVFMFAAVQSLFALQSSLNKDEGLGVYGLAIVSIAVIVSCLFVPSPMISLLGCKWTIVTAMFCYVLYIAGNFYAVWGTMVPASLIMGLGAAPLWAAKCTYLTELALQYAKLTGETATAVVNRFFGIFFGCFQTSVMLGNFASSLILSQKPENETEISKELLDRCGASYCTGDEDLGNVTHAGLKRPPAETIYTLCGMYVASGVVAILILVTFLDRLAAHPDTPGKKRPLISVQLLTATFQQTRRREQLLLIPLTLYSGLEQGFIGGDFTKSYVSCSEGIWNVGYVMLCNAAVDAVCSFGFGKLVKDIGRIPFFVFGSFLHLSLQVVFLTWQPTSDSLALLFVFAGLWGMGDAIWQTQINALYGVVFHNNQAAAFSNYRMWESAGFMLAYVFSFQLCVYVKLYILIGTLALGMGGYVTVEALQKRQTPGRELNTEKTSELPTVKA
ncbi:protein unc-93 homolog A isoform X2 [Lingula anatina]|uniref:Protein unc-93 homolog A isoform X2 n=1 Tax=Lingula anatina TaxID=7574 RepID=A0A1S3HUD5_LINAN|nr:protein unc-93 homolog A isoform X2 [Lingula anatina]|eukprot:XP_013389655.1 protein unc-93 homolog A isoform X2 [Lingula anatina]